jgi:hypothetical protein
MTRAPRGARDFHVTIASTELMRFGTLLQSCGRVDTRISEAVALGRVDPRKVGFVSSGEGRLGKAKAGARPGLRSRRHDLFAPVGCHDLLND